MPIVIGGKPESDFTDPVGMLGDCHRRILRFVHVLAALGAQEKGGPLSDQHRNLLATSLRYFREGAPRHTADEEESLFPRLRRLENPEVAKVLALIDSLEQDHEHADCVHAEVDRLGERWLADGRLTPEDAARFAELAGQLESFYRDHTAKEDAEVFPCAARALAPEERKAIGAEMARRRGLGAP